MILDKFVRPCETFDVTNKKHREYYAKYMKLNSWGNSPIQMKSPNSSLSLASYAREQLVQYYINKEFKND
jgi:hypothetical protein